MHSTNKILDEKNCKGFFATYAREKLYLRTYIQLVPLQLFGVGLDIFTEREREMFDVQ